ncbi:MAG: hypothetical protein AB1861_05390 [Cyanobacteriota bacterium]
MANAKSEKWGVAQSGDDFLFSFAPRRGSAVLGVSPMSDCRCKDAKKNFASLRLCATLSSVQCATPKIAGKK